MQGASKSDGNANGVCDALQDSTYKYYEIILIDIQHKVVRQVCAREEPLSGFCLRAPCSHATYLKAALASHP